MRPLIYCVAVVASFACQSLAYAQDECEVSAVYPSGCDPARQASIEHPALAFATPSLQIGQTVRPVRENAISCLQPFALLPNLAVSYASEQNDPTVQMLMQGNQCAPNGSDLAWRVVGIQGRLTAAQLVAAPQLTMWFATSDLQ